MSKLDKLRQIVKEHQCRKIDGVIVDVLTANAILTVYDAINGTSVPGACVFLNIYERLCVLIS